MSKDTKIKIKIKDGDIDAKVTGRPKYIVEAFAHLLLESPNMLFYFKTAVKVAELQINKQSKK